jgi:hypothetical protein
LGDRTIFDGGTRCYVHTCGTLAFNGDRKGSLYARRREAIEDPVCSKGPLADKLARQLVPVWYDEYSIKIGDNIYESIERGLKQAPKVIVLLSKNFLSNTSWARQEFLMAVHRHIAEKVLLPVWVDVDAEEVKRYDLTLAGVLAVRWSMDVDVVAKKLASVLLG